MTVGVRAIICLEDGLLMVQHHEAERGKFFVFPGGGVEDGETLFSAIEREVMEETNIKVKADRIVYIREVKYNGQVGLEFYIFCQWISGKVMLGKDPELSNQKQILENAKIISFDELSKLNWFPEELHNRLLIDYKRGFPGPIYLGVSEI